jgi:hypothetical protein
MDQPRKVCEWGKEDGEWQSACNPDGWRFHEWSDTPSEQGMKFCPFCGKHLVEASNG